MRSSYRVFSVFGIPVELHITFIAFFILLAVMGLPSLLFFALLFTIVLAHELCHSVVAISFGIRVPKITLLPIGGLASVELPENPLQELAISISGPVFNFVLAGVGIAAMVAFNVSLVSYDSILAGLAAGEPSALSFASIVNLLVYVNLLLGGLNALPAFPMDGGRILRSALALWLDYLTATRIALGIGQLFFIFMVLAGFLMGNFWWVILGVFLSFAGSNEVKFVTVRKSFQGIKLGDIASRNYALVNEQVSVRDFMDIIVRKGVRFYFVVDNMGKVRGMVDLNALQSKSLNGKDPVARYVNRGAVVAEAGARVEDALKSVVSNDVILVVDGGRLVGYVTDDVLADSMGYYNALRRVN
ncbi:MAG: site-2 protease family protein [Candidatus Altiarchaeota archaeon]|nr:site-2 protease family protein [Candidatus Altiarchaeota archaeon]